jgi:hypothetical protein
MPFNLNIKSYLRLLTVEATLTDSSEEQTISITESVTAMFGHGNSGNGKMYVLHAKVEDILIHLAQQGAK